jgi:hypothetical protein
MADVPSYGASPVPDRCFPTIFLDRAINFCDCDTLSSIRAIDERASVRSFSRLPGSQFSVVLSLTMFSRYERERGCLSGTGAQVSQPAMHFKRTAASLGSAFLHNRGYRAGISIERRSRTSAFLRPLHHDGGGHVRRVHERPLTPNCGHPAAGA